MKAMEAAAATYRPHLPTTTGGEIASCSSSSSSSAPQSDRASLRASIGDGSSRGNYGLGGLSFQRTRRARRTEGRANPPQAAISSPLKEDEGMEETKMRGLYSPDVYEELTVESVDLVLNEVRPYLISDGGNVEVASVDDGVVSLRLQGACGSCPSSTTTMKMGIERVLNEKFGALVKDVVQVDQQQAGATIMGVDSHLEMLRPAIHNFGGFVQVVSVSPEKGLVEIKYKGPAHIASGIQATIKDAFPDITEVVLVDH